MDFRTGDAFISRILPGFNQISTIYRIRRTLEEEPLEIDSFREWPGKLASVKGTADAIQNAATNLWAVPSGAKLPKIITTVPALILVEEGKLDLGAFVDDRREAATRPDMPQSVQTSPTPPVGRRARSRF